MLSTAENERLTQTGADTPMGETFRQYWQPALLSRELPSRDCAPVRLKILGEEFVAFRDSDDRVGIVASICPHRGANLFFGRNEACGLRCVYHGWKFDVRGKCVDMPNVDPAIADRLRPRAGVRALKVREAAGVVWCHFGTEEPPALPDFEFMTVPESQRFVSKKYQECNWAQACEGGLDTAHFSYLHAGIREGKKVGLHEVTGPLHTKGQNEPPSRARFRWLVEDGAPRFNVLEHDAGLLLCAARTADDNQLYWRMTQYLLPNHSLTPGNLPSDTSLANTWVPIDDTSCWIFCYAWHPEHEIPEQDKQRLASGSGLFAETDEAYRPIRRRANDYLIDRADQHLHSYTGINGISEQDQAIADSQGLIADRSQELLVQTDLGIVRFREKLFKACAATEEGAMPEGVATPSAYNVRSGDAIEPRDMPIETVVRRRFGEKWGTCSP